MVYVGGIPVIGGDGGVDDEMRASTAVLIVSFAAPSSTLGVGDKRMEARNSGDLPAASCASSVAIQERKRVSQRNT